MISWQSVVTVFAALLFAAGAAPADPPADPAVPQLLTNGGFEGPYVPVHPAPGKAQITGSIANGWWDNSDWADVTIDYAEERGDVHGGASAQKVTVKEIRSGEAHLAHDISLEAGHDYLLSFWAKGLPGARLSISLRQKQAPWTTYGDKDALLTGHWQQVSMTAIAKDTVPGFILIFPPTGSSVLIDDASAKDVTTAVSDAPPILGNMLPDASFEAGFGGGWNAQLWYSNAVHAAALEYAGIRPTVDKTTAADQKQSMKFVFASGGIERFASPLVPYNYGHSYTASVWLKSDAPDAAASIRIRGSTVNQYFPHIGPTWQRYSATGVVPYGQGTGIYVYESVQTQGRFWIDGAELVEGTEPSKTLPPAVEITLGVDRPGGVFYDGQAAVLNMATANAPAGSTVHAVCMDLYGRKTTLPAVPSSAKFLRIAPEAAHPRGVFKVTAQVFSPSGSPLGLPIQQVFARLPRPRALLPEQSYFGVHIPLTPQYIQIARAIGARWCRIHDATSVTIWPVVEPTQGTFTFADEGVDAAQKDGMAVLGMLDGGPPWASLHPKATSGNNNLYNYNLVDAPNAESEWKIYVKKVVSHYKGKISYWEVWNEPWGDEFKPGPPETYGTLLKDAYPIVKQTDPNATVVGVDTWRGIDPWTDTVLKTAGGSSSYDQFSYHNYSSTLSGGPDSLAADNAAQFNALQEKYGTKKPLWITECAAGGYTQSLYWPIGSELATRIQYAQAIRFDVTAIGSGVKHIFYYTLHTDPADGEKTLCGLEYDRTIRPIMAARAVLASLIDGSPCTGRTEPVHGVDSYGFQRADGSSVRVLWSYDGVAHKVNVPKGAHLLDAIGNPLPVARFVNVGIEPIYIKRG